MFERMINKNNNNYKNMRFVRLIKDKIKSAYFVKFLYYIYIDAIHFKEILNIIILILYYNT